MTLQLLQETLGSESDAPLHKPSHVIYIPALYLMGLRAHLSMDWGC